MGARDDIIAGGPSPWRVLLVEDCATDQELVARALRDPAPLSGPLALEVVGDADAALAALEAARFAVILVDHSLPGRSGLEMLRELRVAGDETPVVLMTGTGDEALAVAALKQGAADYIVKELGYERGLPVVIDRILTQRAVEEEREHGRRRAAEYTRRLERQVDDQTLSLQRALQESEALRRIGQGLAAARELKPALELVARTTAELVRARVAAVVIRSDTEMVLASVSGPLKQMPGLKSASLPATLAADWAEAASAPMREDGDDIGLLWVGRARAQPFAAHERELLQALADMAALTIANVRAHERLRRMADGPAPTRDAPATQTPSPARTEAEPCSTTSRSSVSQPVALTVPPFPTALVRLIALAESEQTPEAVEEAVGLDPALAARAIQLANAPALGRSRRVSSLREAVMVLGVCGVRNLAFAQFARRLVLRSGTVDQLLWEQSLGTAIATQLVLESSHPTLADDGYLCGLLCNVGDVALNNADPDRYEQAVKRAVLVGSPLSDVARVTFGRDALAVRRDLTRQWSLPPRVAQTLVEWDEATHDEIGIVLRWARCAALRMSPVWNQLLAGRAEPDWLTHGLDAAREPLPLTADRLDQICAQTEARLDVIGHLIH